MLGWEISCDDENNCVRRRSSGSAAAGATGSGTLVGSLLPTTNKRVSTPTTQEIAIAPRATQFLFVAGLFFSTGTATDSADSVSLLKRFKSARMSAAL